MLLWGAATSGTYVLSPSIELSHRSQDYDSYTPEIKAGFMAIAAANVDTYTVCPFSPSSYHPLTPIQDSFFWT